MLESLAAYQTDDEDMDGIEDERLKLMFTCCHPALASEAQVALTLRTVGGLHVPRGVNISATRCFARRHRLPVGERIAGTLVVSYPSSVGA